MGLALPDRLPAKSTPMPPPQRSQAPLWEGSLARGAAGTAGAGAAGRVWVDPAPGWVGGFGRLVMSEMSEFAFAPAFSRTPPIEAGCALELACVAAAPQAAVSKADATRRACSLLIALGITQRPGMANGLDAA